MKQLIAILILTMSLNAEVKQDKFAHAFVGFIIYGGCLLGANILDELEYTHPLDTTTCLIPVAIAGIGKEVYDNQHDGHVSEWEDAAYTMVIPVALSFTLYKW